MKLCLDNDITPILVTTPYLEYYSKWWPDEVLEVIQKNINEVVNEFGIQYWDYSHDERFMYNTKLFSDSDHLNKAGRKLFTQIIIDRVSPIGDFPPY